jgi:hypothetical protein
MERFARIVALCLAALVSRTAPAEERFQSGLQVGEELSATFEPLNVTGPHAGELHCLVCEYGASPVVMVFARELSGPLTRLLAQIDAAAARHRQQELAGFVVFLTSDERLPDELEAAAKKQGLKHVVLSIFDPAGPEGFKVAKDADVTVVLYENHRVKANHAFQKGELTDEAVGRILADLPKILPAAKAKSGEHTKSKTVPAGE